MRRLATFRWQTPAPTSVDEELALFDDGSTRLVVRGSRSLSASIGTYRAEPADADRAALLAAGPEPVDIDPLKPATDAAQRALHDLATRVADLALATPEAVATFHARSSGIDAGGSLSLSLLVVGSGTRAVEFGIDPAAGSVQLDQGGRPAGWADLPDLQTGFVTPDAELLGGLRRRAVVQPGAYGAIAFAVTVPRAPQAVSIEVAGWLSESLPDDPEPGRFHARTRDAEVTS